MATRLIDLSHPLDVSTPPFPGDGPVEITILDSTSQTDGSERAHLNCSRVATSVHCGTHMDAPFHFYGDRATIDAVPLDVCVGAAVLIDIDAGAPEITVDHLQPYSDQIGATGRAVVNTGWYRRWGDEAYFTDHPVITQTAAAFLVASGCRMVGVDFPSVDRAPFPAHLELLGNDVIILENLTNLAEIGRRQFRLIATPLALTGRDGSPIRAVAAVDDPAVRDAS